MTSRLIPFVEVAIGEPPLPGWTPLERWLFWLIVILIIIGVLFVYRAMSLRHYDNEKKIELVGKALVDRDARLLERWERMDAALDVREDALEKRLVSRELFDERTNNQDRQLSWLVGTVQRIDRRLGSFTERRSSPPPFPAIKGRGGKDT